MTLRKLLYMDSTDGLQEANPTSDETALARVTVNGVSGIGINANSQYIQNLPTPVLAGDAVPKSYVDALHFPVPKLVEVNLGSSGVSEGTFVITDASVNANSIITLNLSGEAPTGKDADEIEMDAVHLKALPQAGSVALYIRGLEGNIHGNFRLIYAVSS